MSVHISRPLFYEFSPLRDFSFTRNFFEISHQRSKSFLLMKCWNGDTFASFVLSCYDRHSSFPNGELLALTNLFSCFVTLPPVNSLINFPTYFKRVLEKYLELPTKTLLIPCFSFEDLKSCLLLPISHHYGKTDLFGLLENLVIRLQISSDEHWVLSSTHLRIVREFLLFYPVSSEEFLILFCSFRQSSQVLVSLGFLLTFWMTLSSAGHSS